MPADKIRYPVNDLQQTASQLSQSHADLASLVAQQWQTILALCTDGVFPIFPNSGYVENPQEFLGDVLPIIEKLLALRAALPGGLKLSAQRMAELDDSGHSGFTSSGR